MSLDEDWKRFPVKQEEFKLLIAILSERNDYRAICLTEYLCTSKEMDGYDDVDINKLIDRLISHSQQVSITQETIQWFFAAMVRRGNDLNVLVEDQARFNFLLCSVHWIMQPLLSTPLYYGLRLTSHFAKIMAILPSVPLAFQYHTIVRLDRESLQAWHQECLGLDSALHYFVWNTECHESSVHSYIATMLLDLVTHLDGSGLPLHRFDVDSFKTCYPCVCNDSEQLYCYPTILRKRIAKARSAMLDYRNYLPIYCCESTRLLPSLIRVIVEYVLQIS